MYLPVGYTSKLISILGKDNIVISDERTVSDLDISFTTNITLRDYQEKAVSELLKRTCGIVEAPTGTGKTYILIEMIKRRNQNTLILVDSYELAEDMIRKLVETTNLTEKDIGKLWGGTRWNIGHQGHQAQHGPSVTVGLLQTVRLLSTQELNHLNQKFGQVLVDEIHIIAAPTYYDCMNRLHMRYRYGFSATPERTDGLTPVLFFITGPKAITVTNEETQDVTVQPTITVINTDFTWPLIDTEEYSYMVSDLGVDKNRNKLIVDHYNSMGFENTMTVFLCSRRSQIYELWTMLGKDGGVLISRMDADAKQSMKEYCGLSDEEIMEFNKFCNKSHRKKILSHLQTGKINKIFATIKKFNKGIDADLLEKMYICGPTKSPILLRQSKGRLVRKFKNGTEKHPEIFFFHDIKQSLLKTQGYQAIRILKEAVKTQ